MPAAPRIAAVATPARISTRRGVVRFAIYLPPFTWPAARITTDEPRSSRCSAAADRVPSPGASRGVHPRKRMISPKSSRLV
jgi:hypothetical protein